MADHEHSPQPPPSTHSLEDGAGDEVAPPPSPPLPPADVDSGHSPESKDDSPVLSSAPTTTTHSPPSQTNLTGAQAAPPPPFLPLASYANDNLAQPRASTGRGQSGAGEGAGGANGLGQQQQAGSVVGPPFSTRPRYAPQPYPSSYSHAFSQHHYPYSPHNTTNAHLYSQYSISPSFNSPSTRAQFSLDTVVSRSAPPHTHSTAAFRLETQAVPGRTVFSAVSPAERSAPVPAPQQDEQGGKGGLAMLVTAGQALATPQTSAVEPEREEDVESSGTRKRPIEEDEEGKAHDVDVQESSQEVARPLTTTDERDSKRRRTLSTDLDPSLSPALPHQPLQQRPHPTHPHPQPLSYSPYAPYHPQAFAPSPNSQAALPHFQHQPYPLAASAPSAAPFSALGPFAYPSDPDLYNAAVANLLARQQAAVGAGFGGAAGPPPLPSSAGRYGHGATCSPGGEVVGSAGASAGGEEPLSPYSTFSAHFSTGSPSTVVTSPGLSRAAPKSVSHPLATHQQFQAQGRALPLVSNSGGEGSGGRGGGVPIFGSGQQQRDEQGEEEAQEEVPEQPKKPRGRTKARDDAYVIETVTGCKPFINKLRWLVLHPYEVGDVIGWSDTGNEVIVKYEDERLLNEVLPRTFAHDKMQSFHRQFLSYSFNQVKPPAAASILNPPRPSRAIPAFSFSGSGSAEDEEEEEEEEEELDVNEWRVYRHSHTPADCAAARKGEKEVEKNKRAAEKRKRAEEGEESDEEDEGSEEEEEEAQDDGSVWFARDKINDHIVLRRLKPKGKGGAAAGGGGGGKGGSPAQEKKAPAVANALQSGSAVPSPSPGPSPSPHVQQPAFSAYQPPPQLTYQFSSAQPSFLSGAASSSSSSTFTPQQYVPYPILQQQQQYHYPSHHSVPLAGALTSSSTAHLPPAPVSGPPTRGSAAVTGLLRPSPAASASVSVASSAAVQAPSTPERRSTSTSVQDGEQQEGLRRSGRKRSATKGGYVDEDVEDEE